MCGRYATTRSAAELRGLFEAQAETSPADDAGGWPTPRYNVAPTDLAPLVRMSGQPRERVLSLGRWGLVPQWASDPRVGARMINARAETVATSRAYASAFASRRALVPVDGWYEWRRLPGGGKQPYFITPADGSVLALAGLWSGASRRSGLTFTVVTTAASDELASVHDRMPLLLPAERWSGWLGAEPPSLAAPPADFLARLELRPVDPAVGNVRNDGPELLARVDVDMGRKASEPTLF